MNYRQKKKRVNMMYSKRNIITSGYPYINIIDLETDEIKLDKKIVNEAYRLIGTNRKICIIGNYNSALKTSLGVYIDKGVSYNRFWLDGDNNTPTMYILKSRCSNKVYVVILGHRNVVLDVVCGELVM